MSGAKSASGVRSPLTGKENVKHVRSYPAEKLVREWQEVFAIDISGELAGIPQVEKFQCQDSGLFFYLPEHCEGAGAVYEGLGKFDWYYLSEKWEYSEAIRCVGSHVRLLEVG